MAGFLLDTRRFPAKIIRGPDIPTRDRAYFHGYTISPKTASNHLGPQAPLEYPRGLGPSTENIDKSTRTHLRDRPQLSGVLDLFPLDRVPSTRAAIMPERDVKTRRLEEGVEAILGVGGSAAYLGEAAATRRSPDDFFEGCDDFYMFRTRVKTVGARMGVREAGAGTAVNDSTLQ